jgi:hypothetical protein
MRNPVPFDTHAFVKRLISAGVPEAQAEANVENLAEVVAHLVTKDDLLLTREELRQEILQLENRINQRFTQVEQKISRVEQSIVELDLRLTIRVGLMLAALAGILTAIQRLFPVHP